MANPICLSPLKFYDNIAKQNHRKNYAYGNIFPLVMRFNILDPFQFILPLENKGNIQAAILYNINDTQIDDITNTLNENGLCIKEINNYKIVMYNGIFPITKIKKEGSYYIKLIIGNNIYYSEVFCFTNNVDKYLVIEYYNKGSDFLIKNGIITFTDNFKFRLRIKSELGKPEYSFEEEATKRLGYSFIESQVSTKIYKFNAVLPEYLCDALRIIRLCSNKTLISNNESYDMLTFDMDVEWQEQGDLASVNCEFQVDNIIVNLGGSLPNDLGGDFNNDFNNDYLLQ